jgi:hypothetical protein
MLPNQNFATQLPKNIFTLLDLKNVRTLIFLVGKVEKIDNYYCDNNQIKQKSQYSKLFGN